MNGEYQASIEDVVRAVRASEIFDISFPMLNRTLLIDLRTNALYPPFVRLVPFAKNPRERIQYLMRMRPGLPRINHVSMIPWNRYARSLSATGVSQVLVERVADTGDGNALDAIHKALDELNRLEHVEMVAAVTGENYQTVWTPKQRR